jgi:hypothetical protein
MDNIGPHLSAQSACPQAVSDDWMIGDVAAARYLFDPPLFLRHMKTSSVASLMLLLVACATTSRTTPSLIAHGPTSLVRVRDGTQWGILKDHSS